jgi:hypothetical protein
MVALPVIVFELSVKYRRTYVRRYVGDVVAFQVIIFELSVKYRRTHVRRCVRR